MNSQTQELQALEARLRDTEERLKERQLRDASLAGRNNATHSSNRREPGGNISSGEKENSRLESSTTSPQAKQAPATQAVSASTMSQWRPTQSNVSGTGGEYAGDASFARPRGQENSRYVK